MCSAFGNRARYLETCIADQSPRKWIWGLQVSHHHMLRAVSESFVLLAPCSWKENAPIASVCFCKSKQQDSAPGKVNDVYRMGTRWEILMAELYEIRAVNKRLQKRTRPKSPGCCSTSCSLLIYTYKLYTGETFSIENTGAAELSRQKALNLQFVDLPGFRV